MIATSNKQQGTRERKRQQATSNKRQGVKESFEVFSLSPVSCRLSQEKGFRRLDVWKKADELAYRIYKVTKDFPKHELFGLVSQMRRSAVSVPANIAEGYAHYAMKEKNRFYEIANCSLVELEYYIYFVNERLKYIDKEQHDELSELRSEVGRMLNGLIRSTGGKRHVTGV